MEEIFILQLRNILYKIIFYKIYYVQNRYK